MSGGRAGTLDDEADIGPVVHDPEAADVITWNGRFHEMLGYDAELYTMSGGRCVPTETVGWM